MIRSSSRRNPAAPVYRDVLSRALRTAWNERRFWPLAFGAAILMGGGSYDVILKATNNITTQGALLSQSGPRLAAIGTAFSQTFGGTTNLLRVANGLESIMMISLVLVALAVLSCICQGGLVYALGSVHRGGTPTVRDAVRIGGGAFWPIAALNALSLATLWILRFLIVVILHFALSVTTAGSWFTYLVAYIVFISLVFAVSMIEIFALNAMILQGAPVADAIVRGYVTLKKHWVVAIETTALLFLCCIATFSIFVFLFLILLLPFFAAFLAASVLQSYILLQGILGVAFVVFLFGIFAATAFTTVLQYATWTYLYRRLGEGGVMPKLHRLFRAVSGHYTVPQA